jgi:hypothetical protein
MGPGPIGLELETSIGVKYAMFPVGSERAFIVGSSLHSDVRLPFEEVAAIEFHIERYGEELSVLPASSLRKIRVNGRPVVGMARLPRVSSIEFSGQRIIARTFDATGVEDLEEPRDEPSGIAYIAALPATTTTTGLGLPTVSRDEEEWDPADDFPTTALIRSRGDGDHGSAEFTFDTEPSSTRPDVPLVISDLPRRKPTRTESIEAQTPTPTGPHGTEVIRLSEIARHAPVPPPETGLHGTEILRRDQLFRGAAKSLTTGRSEPALPPPASSEANRTAAEQACPPGIRHPASAAEPNSPALPIPPSLASDTTEIDSAPITAHDAEIAPQQDSARGLNSPVPSTAELAARSSTRDATVETPSAEANDRTAQSRDVVAALVRGRTPRVLVTRLGLLARQRPIPVALGTLITACSLATCLAGAARLLRVSKDVVAHHVPAPVRSAASVPMVGTASLAFTPASPAPANAASAALLIVMQASASSDSVADPAPSASPDLEASDAVQHLVAGRDLQAKAAYERLAARSPENPAYATMTRLLERASSPACAATLSPASVSCPEVKR